MKVYVRGDLDQVHWIVNNHRQFAYAPHRSWKIEAIKLVRDVFQIPLKDAYVLCSIFF